MNARDFLKHWLPPIAWVLLIFLASTDLMSAEHTSRFIGPLLRWISPDVTPATIAAVQLIVRKAAHVMEYAILAVLLARALAVTSSDVRFRRGLLVMFCAGCCAVLDEYHQSFVVTRTGSLVDVFIDVTGAGLGLALYLAFARRKRPLVARAKI